MDAVVETKVVQKKTVVIDLQSLLHMKHAMGIITLTSTLNRQQCDTLQCFKVMTQARRETTALVLVRVNGTKRLIYPLA